MGYREQDVFKKSYKASVAGHSVKHGMEWSGMEWIGMEWNGMVWNGLEWN